MNRSALAPRKHRAEPENPFWISYSDLMTALTIMLILMVSAFLLRVHQEKKRLDEQKKTIDEQQQVKKEIITQLLARLGKRYPVVIDQRTGAVTIADQILFGFDQSTLTDAGKAFLKQFVPDYAGILLKEKRIREHIAQIMVVGFADKKGTYNINLLRSVERAYAVSTFVFDGIPSFPEREALRQVLSTNGRSFMDLKASDALSRRVEFKFQMKDWDLVKAGRLKVKGLELASPKPGAKSQPTP